MALLNFFQSLTLNNNIKSSLSDLQLLDPLIFQQDFINSVLYLLDHTVITVEHFDKIANIFKSNSVKNFVKNQCFNNNSQENFSNYIDILAKYCQQHVDVFVSSSQIKKIFVELNKLQVQNDISPANSLLGCRIHITKNEKDPIRVKNLYTTDNLDSLNKRKYVACNQAERITVPKINDFCSSISHVSLPPAKELIIKIAEEICSLQQIVSTRNEELGLPSDPFITITRH